MFIFTLGCRKNHHRSARARDSHVHPLKLYEHRQRRRKATRPGEKGFHALISKVLGLILKGSFYVSTGRVAYLLNLPVPKKENVKE